MGAGPLAQRPDAVAYLGFRKGAIHRSLLLLSPLFPLPLEVSPRESEEGTLSHPPAGCGAKSQQKWCRFLPKNLTSGDNS